MDESSKKIRAILFDLGETLITFGKVHGSALFKESARLSYDYLKELGQPVGNFRLYCFKNLAVIRFRFWLSNRTGNDFDSMMLLKKLGTRAGYKLTDQQWEHLAWLWYEPLGQFGKAEADIIKTLTTLTNGGVKLGIISNTFVHRTSLERHLRELGMLDFFAVRMFSYEFSFRKPDARIFNVAAERIGAQLENIMFVGDRLDKDVAPALRLGMTAVMIRAHTNSGKKAPQRAYTIETLAELPSLIEKINSTRLTASEK